MKRFHVMQTCGLLLCLLIISPALRAQIDSIPPPAELIGDITPKKITLERPLEFTVLSDLPAPVTLRATNLPTGADFTDNHDGTGVFTWTPRGGQEGVSEVFFEAIGGSSRAAVGGQFVSLVVSAVPLSHGMYRIGYEDATIVEVTGDHITHTPPNKIDMHGEPFGDPHRIVAAADGRVMEIVDTFTACCSVDGCSSCNNHVRIKHSNGEWTKYTHFQTGTVTGAAGLSIGDCVTAGTFLGWEGDVGHTSGGGSVNRAQVACDGIDTTMIDTTKKCGIHLHFEIRATSPSSDLRIPLICDIDDNIFVDGQTYAAYPCNDGGCPLFVDLPVQAWGGSSIEVVQAYDSVRANIYNVSGTASVAFFAGTKIHLKPGFRAAAASYFHAMILPCDGGPTGCPSP